MLTSLAETIPYVSELPVLPLRTVLSLDGSDKSFCEHLLCTDLREGDQGCWGGGETNTTVKKCCPQKSPLCKQLQYGKTKCITCFLLGIMGTLRSDD